MASVRFDRITRVLTRAPSRRVLAGALLGSLLDASAPQETLAKKGKKCGPCKKRKKGKCKSKPNGAPCGGGKVCQGGKCRCRTTCIIAADCCNGQDCLSNGSCAKPCTTNQECGEGCGCQLESTEGGKFCVELLSCQQASGMYANITGCMAGSACMEANYSVGPTRCFLCAWHSAAGPTGRRLTEPGDANGNNHRLLSLAGHGRAY
jgi:hypothetical protein